MTTCRVSHRSHTTTPSSPCIGKGPSRMATGCLWWWLRAAVEACPLPSHALTCLASTHLLPPQTPRSFAEPQVCVGLGMGPGGTCRRGRAAEPPLRRRRRAQRRPVPGAPPLAAAGRRKSRAPVRTPATQAQPPAGSKEAGSLCFRGERERCSLNMWCRTHLGAANQLAAHRQLIDDAVR